MRKQNKGCQKEIIRWNKPESMYQTAHQVSQKEASRASRKQHKIIHQEISRKKNWESYSLQLDNQVQIPAKQEDQLNSWGDYII